MLALQRLPGMLEQKQPLEFISEHQTFYENHYLTPLQ